MRVKLTEKQKLKMRDDHFKGGVPRKQLEAKYGVSKSQVRLILLEDETNKKYMEVKKDERVKLSQKDKDKIKRKYKNRTEKGGTTYRSLAEEFGISKSLVQEVLASKYNRSSRKKKAVKKDKKESEEKQVHMISVIKKRRMIVLLEKSSCSFFFNGVQYIAKYVKGSSPFGKDTGSFFSRRFLPGIICRENREDTFFHKAIVSVVEERMLELLESKGIPTQETYWDKEKESELKGACCDC